jgi:hypothetical protein
MKYALIAFALSIGIVNLIAAFFEARKLFRKKIRSCDGVIVVSKIGQTPESMYWPSVEYEYQVLGQTIRGRRISYVDVKTSRLAEAEKRLRRYPEGSRVRVFYNAGDIGDSYLTNPKKHIATVLAFAVVMFRVTYFLVFMLWKVVE